MPAAEKFANLWSVWRIAVHALSPPFRKQSTSSVLVSTERTWIEIELELLVEFGIEIIWSRVFD